MSLKLTPVLICLVTVKIILGQYTITKSKDYVVTGSSITFTCNTGSSVSGILWITSLNFPVSQESGTSCGGCQPQYQCSCSGGTVFNLTINNIDLSYDGTGWACGPAFGGTQSNTEIMIVVAPVNYTFTEVSGSRPNSLDITEGNSAIFTCVVQGAKPEPTVSQILWYVDSNKLPVSITGSPTTTDRLTTLSVTYTASREHDGQKVFCAAENDLMINQSIPAVNSSNKIELHILTLSTSSSSSVSSNSPTAGSTTASTGSSTTSVNTSAPSQDLTNTFIAIGACAGILVCGITAAVCFCRKSKVCCFRKSVDKKKTSRDDSAVNETTRPRSDVSYNSGFADTGPNYDNPPPAVLQTTGLPDTNTSRVTQNFSHNPLADNQPPVHGSYKSEDNKYVFYSGSRNVDTNDVNGPGNNRFGGSDYYNQSKKDSRPIDRNIQMSRMERSHNTRI